MLTQNEIFSENAVATIRAAFAAQGEWLLSNSMARDFPLQSDEIEISQSGDKLFLSCLTVRGWQTWRVVNWQKTGEKLIFEMARKLRGAAEKLEFVPRLSIRDLQADVNEARRAEAHKLAELARKTLSNWAKIERISLNQSNQPGKAGTIARVLLALPNNTLTAVCGSIVPKTNVESFLSNAILWFLKLPERRQPSELWLVVEEQSVSELQKLHALLRDGWRKRLKVFARKPKAEGEKHDLQLVAYNPLTFADLWSEKPKKLVRSSSTEMSETAARILELAPNEIDVMRSKYGETLRFNGLAFLRIRQVMGAERVWFGVKEKHALDQTTLGDLAELLEQLREHRCAETSDKRNALYRAAPESWLESLLRRDVSRLDPNLVLAPLYAQFRLSNKQGALDLLALRTDGRLVVIELKTTADREHAFQAASYWRQVELQRSRGNLQKIALFGELKILDQPPLVYLVAPLISFHHHFDVLISSIAPEIEIWRFDLNEDWRREIRVARRTNFTLQSGTRRL